MSKDKAPGQETTVTLKDGTTLNLQVTNPDMARWDMTRHKHKWPSMSEAPVLWATFTSWAAARRLGLTEVTFDAWRDSECIDVDMPQDEEDEDGLDPTQ